MRQDRASFTAAAVSAARAIAGVDPIAVSLLTGPLRTLARATARGGRGAVNAGTLGLVDHLELRTRAIDAAARDAIAAGIRQVVVLGAGLDARAWRMPELAEARVLEVDHPATQRYKRARIAGQRPQAREVSFVPVDFEREALEVALSRGGHAEAEATLWIWEGVTPYLGIEAVRATLETIRLRSAPGSRLAVTYGTPDAAAGVPALTRLARACFRAFGEPLLGLLAKEEMHAELARAQLRVVEDTSPRDWAARHGRTRGRILLVEERMAVAARE